MERFTQKRKHEEETWYRQQELLLQAEKERRQIIELEEQKLKDQRERSCARSNECHKLTNCVFATYITQ